MVAKELINNGKINKDDDKEIKREIAAKLLIEDFMTKDLKIDKNTWNKTKIETIQTGKRKDKDNNTTEVIYITFEKMSDLNDFNEYLKNAEEDKNNRVCNFIKPNSFKRFQFYDHMAWEARQRGKRTKIHCGKHDFLLLIKEKNDNNQWKNVAPRIIENVPDFEMGELNEEDKREEKVQQEERMKELKRRSEEIITEEKNKTQKRKNEEDELMMRFKGNMIEENYVNMEKNDEEENKTNL